MHPRYPAPNANVIFDDRAKYDRWKYFTDLYAYERIVSSDEPEPVKDLLVSYLMTAQTPSPSTVESFERLAGHDVVAFLAAYTKFMPEALKPYIHYGLTSSDLVDNGHFMAMRLHAKQLMLLVQDLDRQLHQWEAMETPRAGRTHGQVADMTSLNHQLRVHSATLSRIRGSLEMLYMDNILKSPGPTGHSPLVEYAARQIAARNGWQFVRSTQVIPRDWQVEWASVYVRLAGELESLATFIRCGARQEIGELREGASRIGSSSMPTKKNPIDCEKVCGLARVARGYFSTLAENVALWDDRDISNSSVERIAVPELAATVEHMTLVMTGVMQNLDVDYNRMRYNAENVATMTNLLQTLAQKYFKIGPVAAGKLMREVLDMDSVTIDGPRLVSNGYNEDTIYLWKNEAEAIWDGLHGGTGPTMPWVVLSVDSGLDMDEPPTQTGEAESGA